MAESSSYAAYDAEARFWLTRGEGLVALYRPGRGRCRCLLVTPCTESCSVVLPLHVPQVALGPLVAEPTALLVRDLRCGPSRVRAVLGGRLLTQLRQINYCLYLLHLLVLYVTRDLVPGPVGNVTGCVIALVVAELRHRGVQDPCRRRLRDAAASTRGSDAVHTAGPKP